MKVFSEKDHLLSHELKKFTELIQQDDTEKTLALTLLLKTGMRRSELLLLKKSDFNASSCTIYITATKNSLDRELPINDKRLVKRLEKHLRDKKELDKIISLGYSTIRDAWYYYRPVKKKLHCLRHTFAVELYKKCKDIKLVKAALGHKSINNTLIYLDYINTKTDLKKYL